VGTKALHRGGRVATTLSKHGRGHTYLLIISEAIQSFARPMVEFSVCLLLCVDRKLVGLRGRGPHRCRGVVNQLPKRSGLAGVIQRALVSVRDDPLS
jgi:hypothetical protein